MQFKSDFDKKKYIQADSSKFLKLKNISITFLVYKYFSTDMQQLKIGLNQ
jgi:hypothetical protein